MEKTSFKSKNYHSEEVLELVYIDLCGSIGIESYSGDNFFIPFVDDYSRMMTMLCLKEKYEAFQKFKWYLERVEKETRKKLKHMRSNLGCEFISNGFDEFFIDKGIKRQVSAHVTPKQNGIEKRRNRSIMDCEKTLMIERNVAISTEVHTLNRGQLKKDPNQTLYEQWYGYKPNVITLKYLVANFIS